MNEILRIMNRHQRRSFVKPQHLENWLGKEKVAQLSALMKDYYWRIPVDGVPGAVFAMPGGDFTGHIAGGGEACMQQRARDLVREFQRNRSARLAMTRRQLGAISNLDTLINNATTNGKRWRFRGNKVGVASNAIGNTNELWTRAGTPTAGAAGGAAPGGTVTTSATTGALPWTNPGTANSMRFVTGWPNASVINNTLLLVDQLGRVAKTMNSTANEAVSMAITRYTNTTPNNDDYAGGNVVYPANPTTVLPATAHNWVAGGAGNGGCTYTNAAGTTGQNFQQMTGVSAAVVGGLDTLAGKWFMDLSAGDVGVANLTKMECSALVATGTIDFVVAHPLAWLPHPIANMICVADGVNTAFNLERIYDNACLTFLETLKPATTATTYNFDFLGISE